uniref:Farnesyl pyrophosphate synthase n=1 Tax=Ciona savignyi TaxID=51511 RepID=H2ZHX6_CIOSA
RMNGKSELWDLFEKHFPVVVNELCTAPVDAGTEIQWSFDRIKDLLEYNVPQGKRTRGLTVVAAYKALAGENFNDESLNLALTMGWTVEILQASFLVADDLMDQSKTRRGQKCWYLKPTIGYQAVNDSMILESCVFTLLRNHCRGKAFYADLFDLFHKVILSTEMGQSLDMQASEQPTVDFSLFTEAKHAAIIKYKTAYYSFYLPVATAMYLVGIRDDECHTAACNILTKIGSLFQVQDDFLDCYGDPEVTGKIGTDIEDNKCSWLIIKAVQLASPEQTCALQENYAKKNPENVAVVKQIFNSLGLKSVFLKYEEDTYKSICDDVNNFQDSRIPHSVFLNLLKKIYKRKK